MITEIIFIILTFLITGYGIYRYGGNEVAGQEIVAPGNGGVQNDVNIPIVQNNDNNNIHINPNININNINNENNGNNDTKFFKNQVIGIIERKEEKKNIDWGDLETTARGIENCFTYEGKSKVQDPLEQIKNILNEEKLKRGEKAVNNWLERNNVNIENRNIQEIVDQFHNSEENGYKFEGEDFSFSKFLLTHKEIESIIGKIKPCIVLQNQENKFKQLERQFQMEEEEKKKEEEKFLEEEKRLKEIEKKAKEAERKIVDEPQDGNPDVTTICFRYPDGVTTKNRKFLKSNKIQNLYDYVTSLGNSIYSEEGHNSFSLYKPFPPKKYEQMENTLEQEELCPNAVIQIKEE